MAMRVHAVIASVSRTLALSSLLIVVSGCSEETATKGKTTIPDSKVFSKTKVTKSPPAHAPKQ